MLTPLAAAQNIDPAVHIEAIDVSSNDTGDLSARGQYPVRVYVGGTGDVVFTMADGSTAKYQAVPVGTYLYVRPKVVNHTGTTATKMVVEWAG